MLWIYLILTFIFGIITGFAQFSQGALFHSAAGQVIKGILSIIGFGLIGWTFWHYGWKIGVLEVFVIFAGSNVGLSIFKGMQRRM